MLCLLCVCLVSHRFNMLEPSLGGVGLPPETYASRRRLVQSGKRAFRKTMQSSERKLFILHSQPWNTVLGQEPNEHLCARRARSVATSTVTSVAGQSASEVFVSVCPIFGRIIALQLAKLLHQM